MRIERIQATEVEVPFRTGWTDSAEYGASSWKSQSKWIIEVTLAGGLIGIGETPRGVTGRAVEMLGKHLLGKALADINLSQLYLPPGGDGYLLPPRDSIHPGDDWEYQVPDRVPHLGFEIALWDLMGKLAGLPLHALFGGSWRKSVPMGFWIGRMNAADAERQARTAVELGFQSMKIKAFPQDDIASVVRAVHAGAGFAMPVVIDSNRKFQRLGDALKIDRTLREFDGVSYEDPFPYHPTEWQEFRRSTERPLYWHATKSQIRADPVRAGMDGTCDGLNISPFSAKEILRDAENASLFNLLHWQGSGLDLGIFDAFLLHTSAASRTAGLPGDAIGHVLREDDLIEEELPVIAGAIVVPEKPGLGVTPDRSALRRYAKAQWEISG